MSKQEDALYHCRICNVILGTHSRGYCRDKDRCGCYCVEDDGTFPLISGDPDEYPRFISLERAIEAGALKP
jgi:hypothetical protein